MIAASAHHSDVRRLRCRAHAQRRHAKAQREGRDGEHPFFFFQGCRCSVCDARSLSENSVSRRSRSLSTLLICHLLQICRAAAGFAGVLHALRREPPQRGGGRLPRGRRRARRLAERDWLAKSARRRSMYAMPLRSAPRPVVHGACAPSPHNSDDFLPALPQTAWASPTRH